MPIFKNHEILINVLKTLSRHQTEIRSFYRVSMNFQVSKKSDIQILKDAFAWSVSERRGASFDRGKKAVDKFNILIPQLVDDIQKDLVTDTEQAYIKLFEAICQIPNIDQKIAAMFLKFVVVYLDVWPRLMQHLFVPIDRVVLKILKDKLKVYCGPWEESPTIKNPQGKIYLQRANKPSAQYSRFLDFQCELNAIASKAGVHRILVDELWFIGNIFCKEYPLCERCWIKPWCVDSH